MVNILREPFEHAITQRAADLDIRTGSHAIFERAW
jgi:hypothetical protein